jgi:hypothetical protein
MPGAGRSMDLIFVLSALTLLAAVWLRDQPYD